LFLKKLERIKTKQLVSRRDLNERKEKKPTLKIRSASFYYTENHFIETNNLVTLCPDNGNPIRL